MKNENRWGSTLTQRDHEGERSTSGLRIGFQPRLHDILFVFHTHRFPHTPAAAGAAVGAVGLLRNKRCRRQDIN